MLKKAENYEEAKKIVKFNAEDKETTKRGNLSLLLRWGFVTTVGTAAFAIMNGGSLDFGAMELIPLSVISGANLIPLFVYSNVRKKMKNGEYFEGKSEEEIINEANEYVEWRNELEAKGKIK